MIFFIIIYFSSPNAAKIIGISQKDSYLFPHEDPNYPNLRRNIIQNGGGIDYFISSHLIEDESYLAQRKYSERLILTHGMTTIFPRPEPPLSKSEMIGLNSFKDSQGQINALPSKREFLVHFIPELDKSLPQENEIFRIYSIPQTLYKVHPDFDEFIKSILTLDTSGFIAVPRGLSGSTWLDILKTRMLSVMSENMLQRIIYLPVLNSREFITFCAVSDVILDTFPVGKA